MERRRRMLLLLQQQQQGPIATSQQWPEQAGGASASASSAPMPFLALLQGAIGEEEGGGRTAQYGGGYACPCPCPCPCPSPPVASDVDLLQSCVTQAAQLGAAPDQTRRRKRLRPRPLAGALPPEKRRKTEEAESQRMTHIAVERNRRRLMNSHLASLRSLVPSSFIPRGDQATVVGGAIDYVKQLEQQLVALQATVAAAAAQRGGSTAAATDGVFVSPQYTSYSEARGGGGGGGVDVEAMPAVGGHVRVHVAGRRLPGRLVRAVAAMEDLRLAVLHLAVTSLGDGEGGGVLYCFNLKMDGGCDVVTADEVAAVVHQIFVYAAGSCC